MSAVKHSMNVHKGSCGILHISFKAPWVLGEDFLSHSFTDLLYDMYFMNCHNKYIWSLPGF